jgi:hypothetical protein
LKCRLFTPSFWQLRLFQRVRLEEKERRMLLYDEKDELVMGAELGLGIPAHLHPYSCLPAHQQLEGLSKCLEWKDHARLRQGIGKRCLKCFLCD